MRGLPTACSVTAEVQAQALAEFVIASDLLLQFTTAEGEVGCVSAIDLDTDIEPWSELAG